LVQNRNAIINRLNPLINEKFNPELDDKKGKDKADQSKNKNRSRIDF
jgi:hypothetical protein